MNLNLRKTVLIAAASAVMFLSVGCGSSAAPQTQYVQQAPPPQVVVQPASNSAAEGLNLQALGALATKASNAASLEQMINQPGGVNNLDLNGDGKVDYISVSEFQKDGARGFSLTTDLGGGQVQEVATLVMERNQAQPTQINVQVAGNPQIYGQNQYYASQVNFTDALIFAWLFAPHPVYYSPYHYGYYPSYYGMGYAPMPYSQYRSYTTNVVKTSTVTVTRTTTPVVKTQIVSPNAGRTATNIKASLAQPTQSQRDFAVRNPSQPMQNSGFIPPGGGKPATTTNNAVTTGAGNTQGGGFVPRTANAAPPVKQSAPPVVSKPFTPAPAAPRQSAPSSFSRSKR